VAVDERHGRALEKLVRLHHEADARAAELGRKHARRLLCGNGCHECCIDDITVFPVEAEHIRRHHQGLLEVGRPHPRGRCAFLGDRGSCRIYDHRPYVCRSQGLPLRWIDDDAPARPVERRDICPLNDVAAEPLERIPESDCWTIGPFESRLRRLQVEFGGEPLARVPLRSLFRNGAEATRGPRVEPPAGVFRSRGAGRTGVPTRRFDPTE
jgi:hypothetical protein